MDMKHENFGGSSTQQEMIGEIIRLEEVILAVFRRKTKENS